MKVSQSAQPLRCKNLFSSEEITSEENKQEVKKEKNQKNFQRKNIPSFWILLKAKISKKIKRRIKKKKKMMMMKTKEKNQYRLHITK